LLLSSTFSFFVSDIIASSPFIELQTRRESLGTGSHFLGCLAVVRNVRCFVFASSRFPEIERRRTPMY
jgi:hypothetical protein